ncbi:MAG: hypothetical protein ACOX4D_09140 [Bacteroidales bacterium]
MKNNLGWLPGKTGMASQKIGDGFPTLQFFDLFNYICTRYLCVLDNHVKNKKNE